MNEVQFLLISSIHCEPFHLTMSDVAGGVPPAVTGIEGGGSPPLAETTVSGTTVVWLPDSKTETKTREPSALRASARGCLPKISITDCPAAGLAASKTTTCPRPSVLVLKFVKSDAPPDTHTKAFARPGPAKITSVGSSPTSMVRTTLPVARSTMLTESESQLTTQASRSLRAATLTGSKPTGISAVSTGPPGVSWKTESEAAGVLTASRRVPSGVSASG